jgi:flagellar biosynthesis/type III secretory pathway protein FliH
LFRVDKKTVTPLPFNLPLLVRDELPPPDKEDDLPDAPPEASAGDRENAPKIAQADVALQAAREQIERDLMAARTDAEEIVAKARSDADALRSAAEAEIADVRATEAQLGYDAGYADGYSSGTAKAAEGAKFALENKYSELEEANKEAIGGLFASVTRELNAAREELSRAALPLIMDIAEKILGNALTDDDNVIAMINAAIVGLGTGEKLAVRIPAHTAERLFPRGNITLRVQGRDVTAEVVPDDSLPDYGLIIEFGTDGGTVTADAGLSTQLDAIHNALSQSEDSTDD